MNIDFSDKWHSISNRDDLVFRAPMLNTTRSEIVTLAVAMAVAGGGIIVATLRPKKEIEVMSTTEELEKYKAAWYGFNGQLKSIFRTFE